HDYAVGAPRLNEWGLSGAWTISGDMPRSTKKAAVSSTGSTRATYIVLGPAADGKPVRFRITLDGKAPGGSHGADVDDSGSISSSGRAALKDRTFEVQFLDPGVQAFAFPFGQH